MTKEQERMIEYVRESIKANGLDFAIIETGKYKGWSVNTLNSLLRSKRLLRHSRFGAVFTGTHYVVMGSVDVSK